MNFAITLIFGIAAGVTTTDDTGRRYMIGVAAAVLYAIFPAWFGLSLALGFPDSSTTTARPGSFVINLFTIAVSAAIVYALIGKRNRNASQH